MDKRPLTGRTYGVAGQIPALRLIRQILAELGARVASASPEAPCDIGPLTVGASPARVALSAFGSDGRFSGRPESDLAIEAIGGALMGQWTYARRPAYLLTPFATIAHGLLTTAALLAHGFGDGAAPYAVSALQSLLAIQSGFYSYGPVIDPARWSHTPRGQSPTYSTYRADDDWLFLGASTMSFMFKVLDALGLDDLLADPRLHEGPRSPGARAMHPEMTARLGAIIGTRPREAWLQLMKERKIPAGPVLSIEEALAHPQTLASGLVSAEAGGFAVTNPVTVTRAGDAL
ncbi:MAG: CoA transferase, partial [Dehalococcoidia bacterium]